MEFGVIMAKKDNITEDLFAAIGAIVLGKIIYDALKGYRCPRCNYPVGKDDQICSNCGQPLIWGRKYG